MPAPQRTTCNSGEPNGEFAIDTEILRIGKASTNMSQQCFFQFLNHFCIVNYPSTTGSLWFHAIVFNSGYILLLWWLLNLTTTIGSLDRKLSNLRFACCQFTTNNFFILHHFFCKYLNFMLFLYFST